MSLENFEQRPIDPQESVENKETIDPQAIKEGLAVHHEVLRAEMAQMGIDTEEGFNDFRDSIA